jgi:hypothetical protein
MLSTILKNKMAITNALAVITGVVSYLAANDVVMQNPEVVAGLLSALGVLNVIGNLFKGIAGTGK